MVNQVTHLLLIFIYCEQHKIQVLSTVPMSPYRYFCDTTMYIKGPNEFISTSAVGYCLTQNARIANLDAMMSNDAITTKLERCGLVIKDEALWIKSTSTACMSLVNVNNQTVKKPASCSKLLCPLCEANYIATPSNVWSPYQLHNTSVVDNSWIPLTHQDVYVNGQAMSNVHAVEYGHLHLNTGLIYCVSAIQYIMLADRIHLKQGVYWIGGSTVTANKDSTCLVLIKSAPGRTKLSSRKCDEKCKSIYGRIDNITRVLQDPIFVKLLREMTVDRKTTSKAFQRLNSVEDKRLSATTVGAGTGMVISILVIVFVIIVDIPRMTSCCHGLLCKARKQRKVNVCTRDVSTLNVKSSNSPNPQFVYKHLLKQYKNENLFKQQERY